MGSKVKLAKCPVPGKVRNRAFFVWFVCDISSPNLRRICAEFAVILRRDVWKVFSALAGEAVSLHSHGRELDHCNCRLVTPLPSSIVFSCRSHQAAPQKGKP